VAQSSHVTVLVPVHAALAGNGPGLAGTTLGAAPATGASTSATAHSTPATEVTLRLIARMARLSFVESGVMDSPPADRCG
jgi:hypothetical protein